MSKISSFKSGVNESPEHNSLSKAPEHNPSPPTYRETKEISHRPLADLIYNGGTGIGQWLYFWFKKREMSPVQNSF